MVRDLNAALTDGSWAGSTRVRAWPMWAIWSGVTPRPAYEVPGRRRSGHREWWSSDQFFDARLPDGLDVVLVLEDRSESAVDQVGGERPGIEETERLGPVQRLGDTGWLEQVHRTQTRHGSGQRARQRLVDAGDLAADDGGLGVPIGVVDPVVDAATLQGVVDLARPVGRDDHDWRVVGGDRPDLGDGHLEIGQQLEEEGLELLIGPIQLVDQEHGASPIATRLDRLQEWACDEKVPAHDVLGADVAAPGLDEADLEHLAGVVRCVKGLAHVQSLVALEPDQLLACHVAEDFGDLGLADTRLAFEEEGPTQLQGEVDGDDQVVSRQVVAGFQCARQFLDP